MSTPQTNALTYNGWVQEVANLAVMQTTTVNGIVQGVDASFNELIPGALNYAELRIQRDADLISLQNSNSYTLTAGNNYLTIPVSDFVTIQTIEITVNNVPTPLLPASKEFMQNVYGAGGTEGPPAYFAPYGGDRSTAGQTSNLFIVGPYPDSNYPVLVTGTMRMPSLYQNATQALANTAYTFISTWLPDLLIQASMIYVAQYQRNFSANSNDPQMPGSYENQYQALLKGTLTEESRKRLQAAAWTAYSPAPIASPTRG